MTTCHAFKVVSLLTLSSQNSSLSSSSTTSRELIRNSKFEPWRSEAEHATSRSQRLPTILTFTRGWGRNIFVSFKPPKPGTEPRALAWKAAVLTTTLGPPPSTGGSVTKPFMMISNCKNPLVSILYIKVFQRFKSQRLEHVEQSLFTVRLAL